MAGPDAGTDGGSHSLRAVVSLSGGMDSTSLLLHFLARGYLVHGVSFDYGQRHRLELERLQANLAYLAAEGYPVDWQRVDLSGVGRMLDSALTNPEREVPTGFYEQANMRETVVPNRNAIFASIAWGWALSLADRYGGPVALGLGVHAGDHAIYPDCRPGFYTALMQAFAEGNWNSERVQLSLPYLHRDKVGILRDARESIAELRMDFERIFRNTCTSYDPDASGRSQGRTGSDVERILAFDALGLRDPLEYVDPWEVCVRRAREYRASHNQASGEAGA